MVELNLDFPNGLALERVQVNGTERELGCNARLEDDGTKQKIPVCMGGTAIIGCNNYDVCRQSYGERVNDPGFVHVIFRDNEERVTGIARVARAPLISPEA